MTLIHGHGPQDVEAREQTVPLFGDEVVPRVKKILAQQAH